MKRLLVLIICILSITLAGCIKDYPLSEAQTDIVQNIWQIACFIMISTIHRHFSVIRRYEIEPEPTDIPDINIENNDIDESVNMRIMTLMKVTMMKIVIMTGLYRRIFSILYRR